MFTKQKKTQMENPVIDTFGLDIAQIRSDFPMLQKVKDGKPLIYFDSAATSHKPKTVIDRLHDYYLNEYAKPMEQHSTSPLTTAMVEEVREHVAKFIGAKSSKEIVFVRGSTEGINSIALSFSRSVLKEGDEIIISQLEHHANIVPWQLAAEMTGAKLLVAPITANGDLDLDTFQEMISQKTKIVSLAHSSNVLGTVFNIRQIASVCHASNVPLFVDGAQMAPHSPINVQDLDCDFYTFSVHKMGGTSGLGVLYGKEEWLLKLLPAEGGEEMVDIVKYDHSTYAGLPKKFEAGTLPFAEIIAFGELLKYLEKLDMQRTMQYELELLSYATEKLSQINGLKIYGTSLEKEPVISFDLIGYDVKALESYLSDEWNIAVRAGQLSAQPLMEVLKVKSLLRASFTYVNTISEIDIFYHAIIAFMTLKAVQSEN